MLLTYWVAPIRDDSDCYNLRAKTRKRCQEMRQEYGADGFGEPVKVTIEYDNGFDLMRQCLCLSEGRGWWEPYPD